ncbi:glycoside hydrolase family 3 C-terminal domain-containing protein [Lacisediminihabitans sp.]|uniref:glycoside hydrolase family 3 C-terminal domain-containing protein n=1 Tax=Lacisediminihabitans sp. TaxID=2787631 RepID=UPI002F9425E1
MSTTAAEHAALTLEQQMSLLSGADFWRTRALPGIPAIRLADGPHGLRVQADDADHLGLNGSVPSTCFPPAVTLASSWDPDLVRQVGEAVGHEARALGVGIVLGPGLNIKRHPLCGRNFEYYSEDPLLSGRLAAAAVIGIQGTGVGACLKHLAVNNQEHRRFVIDAIVDERTRRELYLRGFEIAVRESRPRMVMAAYNRVNGVHCADDRELLTGILRDEWGFDGVVVSDWGAEADRVAGIGAGMDLEMPGRLDRRAELLAAVSAGALTAEAIGTSAGRIGALANALPGQDGVLADLVDAHDALSRYAAAASAVVLANDGALPLDRRQSIAVIGAFAAQPRYQGGGSSLVTPTRVTTMLDAFTAAGIDVGYAPGYDPDRSEPDAALIEHAVALAASADVAIVMVGLPDIQESEGFDRTTLSLPQQHDDLVAAVAAANARTVVVLSNGAPVLMPWHAGVSAILECYLGGQASGGAAVDALLGVVEPAGRLAETFPTSREDVAADPFFPGGTHQVQYREGLFVGYRHATTAGVTPLFPFGHGLGYGATNWSGAAVDRADVPSGEGVVVSVTVENVGERGTSDVVQVYSRDLTATVLRPRRELVGFARVHLEPGEHRVVEIEIDARSFAFWDVRVQDWRTPSGAFELEVARSSETVVTALTVIVHGDCSDSAEPAATRPIAASDEDFERRLDRAIPAPVPTRPFTRETTVGDLSVTVVGRMLRAVIRRTTTFPEETRQDPVTMAMIVRTTDELPLRGLVQFSNGRTSWAALDALIALANGRPFTAMKVLFRRTPLRRRPGADDDRGVELL